MKRFFLTGFVACAAFVMTSAQVGPDLYFISFTNKDNNTYSLTQPEQFLSTRSLQRRANQQIPVDMYDLPVTQMYVDSLSNMGFSIRSVSKYLNGVVVYTTNSFLLSQLAGISFVQGFRSCGLPIVSTKLNIETEPVTRGTRASDYGDGTTQITQVNGDYLHNLNYRGQGMLISVIDAGFDGADTIAAFDSLHQSGRVLYTWDVVERNSNVYGYHPHGTMVLSIMASLVSGDLIGTAPLADYVLIRTEEGATENLVEEYYLARGLEIADSIGSDAVNVSLGYAEFDDPAQNHTWADLNGNTAPASIAARIAASRGMVIVNSAGNSGDDPWYRITFPADADSILTAGSVNSNGDYSSFSSVGPSADGRIKPDVVAMGSGTTVYDPSGTLFQGSGTSFSSPLLCGLVTCFWQAAPHLMSWEVLDFVRQSADQYTNPDEFRGYGLPDFADALLSVNRLNLPDIHGEFWFDAYPNPFGDELNLKIYTTDSQTIQIQVSDMLGRTVASLETDLVGWQFNMIRIDTQKFLSAGIYTIQVTTEKKRYKSTVTRQ